MVKAHALGTTGFRAPEVTMGQDYNESVDIFSAGVCLFYMVTGVEPFSDVFESIDNHNKQSQQYSLLFSDIKQYWRDNIGYKTIVVEAVKQLILKMIEFNPKDRIMIKEIMQHEWYLGKCLSNKAKLKQYILSLRHQKSQFKDLKFEPPSVTLSPFCIDETDKNLLFTIKSSKETHVVFDTLQKCVEKQLNGNVEYDEIDHVMVCAVPDTEKDEIVEFAVAMYLSRKENSKQALKSLYKTIKKLNSNDMAMNEDGDDNDDDDNGDDNGMDLESKSNQVEEMSPMIYILMIGEIDGRDSKLIGFKETVIKALEVVKCKFLADIQVMKEWKLLFEKTKNRVHDEVGDTQSICTQL